MDKSLVIKSFITFVILFFMGNLIFSFHRKDMLEEAKVKVCILQMTSDASDLNALADSIVSCAKK